MITLCSYWGLDINTGVFTGSSLVAQLVKSLPAMQETRVQSLCREDPLEKGHDNPLQYSCMEKSVDRGVWQATVHEAAKSGT